MSSGAHKYHPSPSAGVVTSYIHGGGTIGVLVEVSCESDFVAHTDEFLELIHHIAMHICTSRPAIPSLLAKKMRRPTHMN
jgi:elongation factor Ts